MLVFSVEKAYIFVGIHPPASRDLKITRETGDCYVKDEAFLIPVKLYLCLDSFCSLVGGLDGVGEEAAVCQPSAEIC